MVGFTDDIHILVNGAIDKPEALLLFSSYIVCFLKETYLSVFSLPSDSDYPKNFIHI